MLRCDSEVPLDPATESEGALKFLTSLQELRELRSQIHHAADYCESAFKNAQEKKTVMDNTREYICRAMVTVVDHLGCVSANLNSRITETDRFSEADLRINCLKQKFVLHGEYNQTVVMSKIGRRVVVPRHFSRYISPPGQCSSSAAISNQEKPEEQSRELESSEEADSITKNKHVPKVEEDLPLFMYTNTSNSHNCKIPLYRSPSLSEAESNTLQSLASVLPVHDGLSIPPETKRAAFQFQMVRKHGRRIMQWRIHDSEILSLIRRSKKESLKLLKL